MDEVGAFYTTADIQAALAFLRKYDVKYIVVGQLERNIYPVLEGMPDGLSKFPAFRRSILARRVSGWGDDDL